MDPDTHQNRDIYFLINTTDKTMTFSSSTNYEIYCVTVLLSANHDTHQNYDILKKCDTLQNYDTFKLSKPMKPLHLI